MLYPRIVAYFFLSFLSVANSFLLSRTNTFRRQLASSARGPLMLPQHEIEAIIFDIDGTLADSGDLGFNATLVILEKHNIPPITKEIYSFCTRYSTPERLARHAGLSPGDADFEDTGARLAREFDDLYIGLCSTETAGFYSGLVDLIDSIPENVKLGTLTNAAVRYAYKVLEVNLRNGRHDHLYERFKSIRGADNVPAPKPDPAGLFQVCSDLSVPPTKCVYIGDSPSDGVAAKAAGMISVAVTWGAHGPANLQEFDHICHTVEELRSLLPVKS